MIYIKLLWDYYHKLPSASFPIPNLYVPIPPQGTSLQQEEKMPWQTAPSLLIIVGAFNVAAGLIWSVDRVYHGPVSASRPSAQPPARAQVTDPSAPAGARHRRGPQREGGRRLEVQHAEDQNGLDRWLHLVFRNWESCHPVVKLTFIPRVSFTSCSTFNSFHCVSASQ